MLRTAATDVIVTTYQGSCARSTIETIMAVSMAPLGNSQVPFLSHRANRSVTPAIATALSRPGNTVPQAFARRGYRGQHNQNRW